jgi:hypothetical protein
MIIWQGEKSSLNITVYKATEIESVLYIRRGQSKSRKNFPQFSNMPETRMSKLDLVYIRIKHEAWL